ncbi:DNA repair protein RecN (Recombination protein N) [Gracilibacillus orientalis]|uniref:DNA repair protein RecN n=1 Tax=Gracilibacillus orientalis TaxID=334253 RepID=A0A1I4KWV5_9BACI|nr:DNA repair protein RecN [Gracilibacillus orientalis]SFL83230.1 DNA repair protein RecN (Recombination protein N) [Gracilibacillus orientalis]
MLTELSIKNFAIIDELHIPFQKGLTVLTGETGAGKSIIIDAVGLLIGGRGSVEYVRHGEKKAELEGLFIIDDTEHPVYQKARELGIDIMEDHMLVLHRTISHSGKSICRINGKLTTLALLKEIGQSVLDIHSQHETQALLNQDKHMELLDYFYQSNHSRFKKHYQKLFQQWKELKYKYEANNKNEQELAQRIDLLEFQLNEIQNADLQPNEDEDLTDERNELNHFELIHKNLNDAYAALHGEQKGLDWLSHAANNLEEAGEHNKDIQKLNQQYVDHYYLIEEISYQIRQHLENMDYEPGRLELIESRLHEIDQLKRKYGQSVEEIMTYSAKIEEELDEIKNRDQHLANLSEMLQEASNDLLLEAKELHNIRKKAAKQLEKAVITELKDLYLEKTNFQVDVFIPNKEKGGIPFEGKKVALHQGGIDQVRFLISTNPGEPVKELDRIASGGEMSRIMLALKNIFSKHQGITSVIFDEVDTGVSGRVAQSMADKIYNISIGSQVLCITHLPQVASIADTHLKIEKVIKENRTHTAIQELSFEQRIDEIGKMITGAELTETSRTHAKELIEMNHK